MYAAFAEYVKRKDCMKFFGVNIQHVYLQSELDMARIWILLHRI